MAMYGIGIIPLTELVQKPKVAQYWYADDGSASGDLKILRAIIVKLGGQGKVFGYDVEPSKCNFIEKENMENAP